MPSSSSPPLAARTYHLTPGSGSGSWVGVTSLVSILELAAGPVSDALIGEVQILSQSN